MKIFLYSCFNGRSISCYDLFAFHKLNYYVVNITGYHMFSLFFPFLFYLFFRIPFIKRKNWNPYWITSLSVCLYGLSVCQSIRQPVCPSVRLSACPLICLSSCPSIKTLFLRKGWRFQAFKPTHQKKDSLWHSRTPTVYKWEIIYIDWLSLSLILHYEIYLNSVWRFSAYA